MFNLTLSSRKAFGNVSNVKPSLASVERSKLTSLKGDKGREKDLKELKDIKVKEKNKIDEKAKSNILDKTSADSSDQKLNLQKPSLEQENGPETLTQDIPSIDDSDCGLEDFHPPPLDQQHGRFFPIHKIYDYHDEGPIPVCEYSEDTTKSNTYQVDFDDIF